MEQENLHPAYCGTRELTPSLLWNKRTHTQPIVEQENSHAAYCGTRELTPSLLWNERTYTQPIVEQENLHPAYRSFLRLAERASFFDVNKHLI